MALKLYDDILASVCGNGYCSIKALVQPNSPQVKEIAAILAQAKDPILAAHEFVNSFVKYETEEGDIWRPPEVSLIREAGDCDCMAILACSILRNFLPPEKVYAAMGLAGNGKMSGHAWVITEGENGEDVIIETTAPPRQEITDNYKLMAIFNDKYAFASQEAINEFDLVTL